MKRTAPMSSRRGGRRLALALMLSALVLPAAAAAQSATSDPVWTMRVGVTLPRLSGGGTVPSTVGSTITRTTSNLTFPRLTIGRQAGPVDVEIGYRKMGVRRYDGAFSGNTHSNSGQLAVAWRGTNATGWSIGVRGGLQLVRTVTTATDAPASWPVESGRNTFRVRPVTAVTAGYQATSHWGVAMEFEPVWGTLGRPGVSDTYRQQLFGLDLVYRR